MRRRRRCASSRRACRGRRRSTRRRWWPTPRWAVGRRDLAGVLPLGLESHEALAEQIADALLDGLGLEHLQTYRKRVLGVTKAQARAMAGELSPARDGALLIVVGEAEEARAALN